MAKKNSCPAAWDLSSPPFTGDTRSLAIFHSNSFLSPLSLCSSTWRTQATGSGVPRDLKMDNNAARSNRAMNPNTPATTAKATLSSSALAGVSFSAKV